MLTTVNTAIKIKQEVEDYYFPVLRPCTFDIFEHHKQKPLVEVLPHVVVVKLRDHEVAEKLSDIINKLYNLRKRLSKNSL